MKPVYKSVKVIYDAHRREYRIYYRRWFQWHYDSCYTVDESATIPVTFANGPYGNPVYSKAEGEKRAIERAQRMLDTVEVWRKSKFFIGE